MSYRYRVVGVHGEVPEIVRSILNKPDAFIVYGQYRGRSSFQEIEDHGRLVGGWQMVYAGRRSVAQLRIAR